MFFRLEHDKVNNRQTSHTYIVPRLFHIITAVIWGVMAISFKRTIWANIYMICPQGKLSALGGRLKRNIVTLGTKCTRITIKCKQLSDGDICLISLWITFAMVDNCTVWFVQTYQDQMGTEDHRFQSYFLCFVQ